MIIQRVIFSIFSCKDKRLMAYDACDASTSGSSNIAPSQVDTSAWSTTSTLSKLKHIQKAKTDKSGVLIYTYCINFVGSVFLIILNVSPIMLPHSGIKLVDGFSVCKALLQFSLGYEDLNNILLE